MTTKKILAMAALALLMAACTNDDNELTSPQPAKAEGIPFSATISIGNSAATRALTETGDNLVATWAENEQVALIHNGVKDVMTVTGFADGVATISGTITGNPADDDDVTVIYPASAADGTTGDVKADLLTAQDGMLAGIATNYDVRKSSGAKLKVVSGTASLKGTVSLTNQFAIFKLTLKKLNGSSVSTRKLIIKNGSNNVLTTVTTATKTNVMYVAVDPANTTLKFSANNGNYFNMVSGLSLDKKYYQSEVKFASVGDVILFNGKCASAGTAGAVAMICKLGSREGYYTNGLAIELTSSPGAGNWATACSNPTTKDAVPGGTWRLPSNQDWADILDGFNDTAPTEVTSNRNIENFRASYTAAGYSLPADYYWSGTEVEDRTDLAWRVYLSSTTASFYTYRKDHDSARVLACLAF